MIRFSSLLAIFLLCIVSAYATKVVDINTICKETGNTSFCLTLLKSKSGADLITLAQYTIDVENTSVIDTINLIKKLISQSGSDPKAKAHYEECLDYFGLNPPLLIDAEKYLKSGDYALMRVQGNSIISNYGSCISGDSPSDHPYPDKSLLPESARVVHDVAIILAVISDFLLK